MRFLGTVLIPFSWIVQAVHQLGPLDRQEHNSTSELFRPEVSQGFIYGQTVLGTFCHSQENVVLDWKKKISSLSQLYIDNFFQMYRNTNHPRTQASSINSCRQAQIKTKHRRDVRHLHKWVPTCKKQILLNNYRFKKKHINPVTWLL